MLDGSFAESFTGQEGWLGFVPRTTQGLRLGLQVHLQVDAGGAVTLFTSQPLPTWAEEFERQLKNILTRTPDDLIRLFGGASAQKETPHDLLLGPGERLTGPFTGLLLDYSGCARVEDITDLTKGDLPLGRYAFGFKEYGISYGPDLFLSTFRTGQPMIYNGALICAPQNSGKTQLIMRWALAANRAGMNVLLVDVKGNLHRELANRLMGDTYYFSTDPSVDDCDGVNFLAGLHGKDAENRMHIRQLVEALLPREGWEAGEQAYFYQNHTNWLTVLFPLRYALCQDEQGPGGRASAGAHPAVFLLRRSEQSFGTRDHHPRRP
jgi:hypothetical protein